MVENSWEVFVVGIEGVLGLWWEVRLEGVGRLGV